MYLNGREFSVFDARSYESNLSSIGERPEKLIQAFLSVLIAPNNNQLPAGLIAQLVKSTAPAPQSSGFESNPVSKRAGFILRKPTVQILELHAFKSKIYINIGGF